MSTATDSSGRAMSASAARVVKAGNVCRWRPRGSNGRRHMLPLEAAIAPGLKAAGFSRKARTWWRRAGETIHVVNLQKSAFGERLYVNLGVYVTVLGPEASPPHNRCHVQVRLERIVDPARAAVVSSARPCETPPPALIDAVTMDGVAWFDSLSSQEGIRRYIATGGANKGLVFATVRQLVSARE